MYTDQINEGIESFAIRNQDYKLIMDENGNQEFYNLTESIEELDDLLPQLDPAEQLILDELQAEAEAIRNGWSCNDFILNGEEEEIDDCSDACPEVDVLSSENIGCCDSPAFPSVYYEFEENGMRNIYSNGFPNHDYCYNPNNIPDQKYHFFRIDREPVVSGITNIIRDNGRPARHFGVAMNGVVLSPAPGTPFIYVNKNTGEFNWDWYLNRLRIRVMTSAKLDWIVQQRIPALRQVIITMEKCLSI